MLVTYDHYSCRILHTKSTDQKQPISGLSKVLLMTITKHERV